MDNANRDLEKLSNLKSASQLALHTLGLPDSYYQYVVVAGGAYVSWYHNERVKDIDIFILDSGNEHTNEAIDIILQNNWKFNSKKSPEYQGYILNEKVTKVYDVVSKSNGQPAPHKYQIIFTKYKTREDLIAHFDFLHCTMNYYMGKLYFKPGTYDCIDKKELRINNVQNAKLGKYRYNKFVKRGFVDNAEVRKRLFPEFFETVNVT